MKVETYIRPQVPLKSHSWDTARQIHRYVFMIILFGDHYGPGVGHFDYEFWWIWLIFHAPFVFYYIPALGYNNDWCIVLKYFVFVHNKKYLCGGRSLLIVGGRWSVL